EIEPRLRALDLGRERDERLVLFPLLDPVELHQRERLDQRLGAHHRQAQRELAGRLIRADPRALLEQHRPGVEPEHHAHDADAGMAAAPRQRGRSDAWMLSVPRGARSITSCRRMWPYATTTLMSGSSPRSCARNSSPRGRSG